MNEQDQRALWFLFHCRRCRKELRILSFRDTRFCFYILFLSFFLSFFFFSLFWTRATDWTEKERQLVLWRTAYVEDLMGLLPFVFWCFFPFLDFPCSFPRMTRYSKRNRGKQLTTRNYSNIFSQRVSQVFSSIDQFWEIFFSIYVGRDNFVISLPSSTAHFNWIPHEFSTPLVFVIMPVKLTSFKA